VADPRRFLLAGLLSLALLSGAASAATRTYSTGALAHPIPDVGTVDVPLAVPDKGPVSYLEVGLRIDHPRDSDLTLSLVSPSGTAVVLVAKRGGNGRNFGAGPGCGQLAYFADENLEPVTRASPPFLYGVKPEGRLAGFNREEASGQWKLRIADDRAGAAGTLRCWRLTVSRDVVQTQSASRLGTEAALSYRESHDVYRGLQLRISHRGTTLFDAAPKRVHPCACPNDGPVFGQGGGALRVRDLDRDGEPEVLVDFYSGGAHCCYYTDVYRYVARSRAYRPTVGFWGDLFPTLVDLGRDGRPEFRTGDDRFAYVFSSFAASAFPIRILRFDHGRFVDVTRRFPQLVRRDAAALYASYRSQLRSASYDVRGVLAAWLADQYLLGRGPAGWRVLERAERRGELGRKRDLWPVGRAYLRKLRTFLRRTGYSR
jgi:subtilisin-like proprotein convertase family protein